MISKLSLALCNFYFSFLFVLILPSVSAAIPENLEFFCGYIQDYVRKDCGYPGITKTQCTESGCCYVETQVFGVPWCYFANDTNYRTSTQPNTVTRTTHVDATTSTTATTLTKDAIQSSSTEKKKVSPSTTDSSHKLMFDLEVQDEINCLQTYRLYQNIRGNHECMADFSQRVSCVKGRLSKFKGESECTACSKNHCCYDPVDQVVEGGRAVPHCYKPNKVPKTTTVTTTTASTSSTSLAITSSNPTKSTRLQSLLNMIKTGQNPLKSTTALMPAVQAPKSAAQNVIFSPPDSTSSSITKSPIIDRNKLLRTPHPTRGPNNKLSLSVPNSPLGSLISLLSPTSNKNSVKRTQETVTTVATVKKLNPRTMILNYLLRKKLGISSSSGKNIMSTPFQDISASSVRKSNFPSLANLFFPQFQSQDTSPLTGNEVLSHLLKKKLPQLSGNLMQPNTPKNLLLNLLQTKVGLQPNPVINSSNARPQPEFNRWTYLPKPIPQRILPVYEVGNQTLPVKTCFPENCGHRATDGQAIYRIVGGQWTGGIEFWPWTASLRRTFTDDDRYVHICGATIISRRWILTAAHCFMAYEKRGKKIDGQKEKFVSVYSVYVGQYFRDRATPHLQIHSLDSFHPHPRFDFISLTYDVAAAYLTEHMWFNEFVQPACLPGKLDPLSAQESTWVVGWGDTFKAEQQTLSKLKELSLPLIPTSQCRKSWPRHFHEAWICTEASYNEDACTGDSGGPLVKQSKDSRWQVIGVAVAGTRECSTNSKDVKPGIYTKVAYFRDFIDSVTRGTCEEHAGWKNGD